MLYIFPKSTIGAGGSRHRAYNVAKFLSQSGYTSELVVAPIYRTDLARNKARREYLKKIFSLRKNDVVLLQNPIFSWYFILCIIAVKIFFGPTLVFDFDDATWVQKPIAPRVMALFSDKFIVASHYLADWKWLGKKKRIVIPNLVDYSIAEKYGSPKAFSDTQKVVLGWIGGAPDSMNNLEMLIPVFKRLSEKNLSCKFLLIGTLGSEKVRDAFGNTGIEREFIESLEWGKEGEIQKANLRFDIGLCPLEINVSNRARCSLKALDYMAAGIPVVLSPVGENNYFIHNGAEGFLPGSEDEWINALETLIKDRAMQIRMGRTAFERLKTEYSYQENINKYVSFLDLTKSDTSL